MEKSFITSRIDFVECKQQRRSTDCAIAQSDQSLLVRKLENI